LNFVLHTEVLQNLQTFNSVIIFFIGGMYKKKYHN